MECQITVRNFKYLFSFIILFILAIESSPPEICRTVNESVNSNPESPKNQPKRLRTIPQTENKPGDCEPQCKIPKYDDNKYSNDIENHKHIKAIVKNYDFITSLFGQEKSETYKEYEKTLLNEILTKVTDSFKGMTPEESYPFIFFTINTSYENMAEFRKDMIEALFYIEENMKNVSSLFFEQFAQVLDSVSILRILDEIEDKPSETKNTTPIDLDDLNWDVDTDDEIELLRQISKSTNNPESNDNIEKYVNIKDNTNNNYDKLKPMIETPNSESKDNVNKPVIDNYGSEKEESNNLNADESGNNSSNNGLNIVFYWNQHLNRVPTLYKPADFGELGSVSEGFKSFATFIKEGFMPSVLPLRSKLAQAMTAAVIIMQEYGIVDLLIERCRIQPMQNKFLMNTLFEANIKKNLYVKDTRILKRLRLDKLFVLNEFKKMNGKEYTGFTGENEELIDAAITFSSKLFPRIDLKPSECATQDTQKKQCSNIVGGHEYCVVEEDEMENSDLKDVLKKGKIDVLIHSRDFDKSMSFDSVYSREFYHRLLLVATELIRRKYCIFDSREIIIEYKRSINPMEDLINKKGHMTGLNFMVQDTYPSRLLFGSQTVKLGVPLLSHNSFVVVNKKFKVRNLDDWYHYINRKDHESKVILTNFSEGCFLFSNALDFNILLNPLNGATEVLNAMDKHNPVAGVFWGIYPPESGHLKYDFIQFPYNIKQGPRFREH
uniref:Uncharacterized protein n=1 Tax=Theileria annulata TaxID=5874 RepID=A0A3B0MQB0_THEAN